MAAAVYSTNSRDVRWLNPTGYKLFDDDGHALCFHCCCSMWSSGKARSPAKKICGSANGLVPNSLTTKQVDSAEVRDCLKRFASRTWRRPASDAEVARYARVFDGEMQAGENPRSAYRAALVGILASKNFYYLAEGSPQRAARAGERL